MPEKEKQPIKTGSQMPGHSPAETGTDFSAGLPGVPVLNISRLGMVCFLQNEGYHFQ